MNVKIQHPGLPDGYQISLTGLNAVLLNNQDVEVDDEMIAQYEASTGKKFSEVISGPSFGGARKPKLKQEDEPNTQEQEQEDELNTPPNGAEA